MEVREINDPSDSDWLEMRGQFWSHLDPSSPSEKHGWRVFGGMMGAVQ